MGAILHALGVFVVDLFKSHSRLEAENLFLRHQLNIALRPARLERALAPLASALARRSPLALEAGGGPLRPERIGLDLLKRGRIFEI